jgi:hypothetical protein
MSQQLVWPPRTTPPFPRRPPRGAWGPPRAGARPRPASPSASATRTRTADTKSWFLTSGEIEARPARRLHGKPPARPRGAARAARNPAPATRPAPAHSPHCGPGRAEAGPGWGRTRSGAARGWGRREGSGPGAGGSGRLRGPGQARWEGRAGPGSGSAAAAAAAAAAPQTSHDVWSRGLHS